MSNQTASDIIFSVWDATANAAAAQARFLEVLQAFETTNLSEIEKAQITTQLARTVGLQNGFEEAHRLLDEAKEVLRASESKSGNDETLTALNLALLRVRLELERGRVYNSAGLPEHAQSHFLAALQAASPEITLDPSDAAGSSLFDILNYLRVDALHMLAIVAPSNAARTAYANQGLAIARSADQEHERRTRSWLGPLLNNFGWERIETRDFKGAIRIFQEAADIRRKDLEFVDMELASSGQQLSQEDLDRKGRQRAKAFTAWKIGVWSVGHAQIEAGMEEDAFATLTGLLAEEADGPSIREDLANLCERKSQSKHLEQEEVLEFKRMAAIHAQRALELGVDNRKAENLQLIIAKYSEL